MRIEIWYRLASLAGLPLMFVYFWFVRGLHPIYAVGACVVIMLLLLLIRFATRDLDAAIRRRT